MVGTCLLLCQEGFRRKWGSIADSVAVAEVAVLPLELQEVSMQGEEEVEGAHQGAAVAKLGAAGRKVGTGVPLHIARPAS